MWRMIGWALRALVAAAVLGGSGYLGWRVYEQALAAQQKAAAQKGAPGRGRSGPVAVELTEVRRGEIRVVRSFSGTLEAQASYIAAPKIAGRIKSVSVHIGDRVKSGQVVALLEDDELRLLAEQAEAELKVQEQNLKQVEAELGLKISERRRVEELIASRAATKADRESAEAQVLVAMARVEAAKAQVTQRTVGLASARVRWSHSQIVASWDDGERVVGERYVDDGAMVSANTPVASILDDREMMAVVFVAEVDYPRLRIDQPVTVTTEAYGRRQFNGRIARIAPMFRRESRQARVEVRLPNPDRALRAGMYVRAAVELERIPDGQLVPASAVVRRGEHGSGVFALVAGEKKTVKLVPVTLGVVQGDQVQVVEPVLDTPIVVLGQHLLRDGSEVLLPAAKASGEAPKGGGKRPGDARQSGGPAEGVR